MKVCIDGIIQEVEETMEELRIEPPKTIENDIAELREKFRKFEELLEPLKKLLGGK